MNASRVIEVDGEFVGTAVMAPDQPGWRVVASDSRLGVIDGMITSTLDDAQRLARRAIAKAQADFIPVRGWD